MANDPENEALEKGRSVALAIQEVTSSMSDVVRSEVRLAKAEMKDVGAKLGRRAMKIGIAAGFLIVGVFPALSFLVIGLGRILGDNYWLSSLVFAVIFFVVGGVLGYRLFSTMGEEDYLLPEMRTTLSNEAEELKRKFQGSGKKRAA